MSDDIFKFDDPDDSGDDKKDKDSEEFDPLKEYRNIPQKERPLYDENEMTKVGGRKEGNLDDDDDFPTGDKEDFTDIDDVFGGADGENGAAQEPPSVEPPLSLGSEDLIPASDQAGDDFSVDEFDLQAEENSFDADQAAPASESADRFTGSSAEGSDEEMVLTGSAGTDEAEPVWELETEPDADFQKEHDVMPGGSSPKEEEDAWSLDEDTGPLQESGSDDDEPEAKEYVLDLTGEDEAENSISEPPVQPESFEKEIGTPEPEPLELEDEAPVVPTPPVIADADFPFEDIPGSSASPDNEEPLELAGDESFSPETVAGDSAAAPFSEQPSDTGMTAEDGWPEADAQPAQKSDDTADDGLVFEETAFAGAAEETAAGEPGAGDSKPSAGVGDLLVSNQHFPEQTEPAAGGEEPATEDGTAPSDRKTAAMDQDSDLPYITNRSELEQYTEKTTHQTVTKSSEEEPLPSVLPPEDDSGDYPSTRSVEAGGGSLYRSDEFSAVAEPKTSSPKRLYLIIVAVVVVMALLAFLFVFKKGAPAGNQTSGTTEAAEQAGTPGSSDTFLQERNFARNLNRARALFSQGNYAEAQKAAREAAAIRTTPDLTQLLTNINNKLEEENKIKQEQQVKKVVETIQKEEAETPAAPVNSEENDFKGAETKNTIEAYDAFMRKYPEGKYYFQAMRNVNALKAAALEKKRADIQSKTRQLKKVTLRTSYLRANQAALEKQLLEMKSIVNNMESAVFDNELLVIDYSTGLMWHFWQRPMNFNSAKLWAMRRFAGYSDWRLPTMDELKSIARINFNIFSIAPKGDFQLWSGDMGYEGDRSVWALEIPSAMPELGAIDQFKYLCSVRTIR